MGADGGNRWWRALTAGGGDVDARQGRAMVRLMLGLAILWAGGAGGARAGATGADAAGAGMASPSTAAPSETSNAIADSTTATSATAGGRATKVSSLRRPGPAGDPVTRSSFEFRRLPSWSIADQLAQMPGVATGQRQLFGVPADLSIRGSTPDQTRVLLDGVDVTEIQTGHHSLDLPLEPGDVMFLDLAHGGSTLRGASAAAGSLDLEPRWPGRSGGGELSLTAGGQGVWDASGSADLHLGEGGLRLSLDRLRADGDRPGTEASSWTATARLRTSGTGGSSDYFFGYSRREFGAADFYEPYPSRERTTSFHAAMRVWRRASERVTIEPRVYFHRHTDQFVLDRDDPDLYRNDHHTQRAGAMLRAAAELGRGFTGEAGAEIGLEDIRSEGVRRMRGGELVEDAALGGHQRQRSALAAELGRDGDCWRWSAGLRTDVRSEYRPRVERRAAADWSPREWLTVGAQAGSLFRVPNFTELYYADPRNLGANGLAPEHGWSWEAGIEARRSGVNHWRARATWFQRRELDVIDWVRPLDTGAPWQARNVGAAVTRGLESEIAWSHAPRHSLALRHTWLDRAIDSGYGPNAGYESKYLRDAPRHLLTAEGTARIWRQLELTLAARLRGGLAAGASPASRPGTTGGPDAGLGPRGGEPEGSGAVLLDARLEWRAPFGRTLWTVAVQGTNLTDRACAEVAGVPLPGRLVAASVTREFR